MGATRVYFSVIMPEFKVKSKCDFVTFIEDLFSEYEIKEGDNKVINLEEIPQEVEMSDLEKSLTKGVNCLFNEILELKKSVKNLQARDNGSERKEEEGRVSGGGAQTQREDGVVRTMDHLRSKPWVTPSNAGNIKETNKLRDEMQKMESQLDEIGQRGLKGMVVCSAPDFKYVEGTKVKIPSLFEKMKTLKPEEGEIATKEEELEDLNKVLALIEKKYGVKVPITEIYGCHFIPNGMHTYRKLGSWSHWDQVLWSHLLDPGAIRVDSGAIGVDSGAIRGDPGAKRGSYRAIKNRLEVKVILNGII